MRFQAYGELEGRIVRLSSELPGEIQAVHVAEGDLVHAGQLLAELAPRQMQREQHRIHREMQIALSNLQVRLAEVQVRNRQMQAERIDRQVRYHQLLGEFHENDARLKSLSSYYDSNRLLRARDAVSRTELMNAEAAYEGRKVQQTDLAAAIKALSISATDVVERDSVTVLLEAEKSRIDALHAELSEIADLMDASQVRAPAAGRVLRRFAQPGEQLRGNDPVLELVESRSVEAVVYMPQGRANVLRVGDRVRLLIEPLRARKTFLVTRISPEVGPPPETLRSKYRAFRGLVRVHARPIDATRHDRRDGQPADLTTLVGAELALPRFGFRIGKEAAQSPTQEQIASETGGGG
jgi:HlyD family secretion protein